MQAANIAKTAIVFSCDENYIPLAKGLVLSLRTFGFPRPGFDVVLIDIGCSPQSLDWMRMHDVKIDYFDPELVPDSVLSVINSAQRALIMRPWLPEIVEGYDLYIWLDADTWLQSDEPINVIYGAQSILPGRMFMAPGVSHYSTSIYDDLSEILGMQSLWYATSYKDDHLGGFFAKRLHYSSGVFGLARNSEFWNLWKEQIIATFPLVAARARPLLHMAELVAANYIVQRNGNLLARLDPLYNFHCNSGGAMRIGNGDVSAIMIIPVRRICVVHLANWPFLNKHYMEGNLLYQSGAYLTDAERTSLMNLSRN
jgi:hypothetical protein